LWDGWRQFRYKRVLEPWGGRLQGFARKRCRCAIPEHNPQCVACHHRIQHRRVRCRPPCCRAPLAGGNREPEHPTPHRRKKVHGRSLCQQAALMQQHDVAATFGLIEVRGGPDRGHAFVAALVQHRRYDRPQLLS
jgi:hypothetical protein